MGPPSKTELRRALRAARAALDPAYRRRADAAICELLLGTDWFLTARVIAAYAALSSEVQTLAILDAVCSRLGVIGLPVEDANGQPLLVECREPAALVPGPRGVSAPSIPWKVVDPTRVELIFVPGVGFDRSGRRLGRGAGFYDKLLPFVPGRKVGLAYAVQLVDTVPEEAHDARLDAVVTEAGVLEFS